MGTATAGTMAVDANRHGVRAPRGGCTVAGRAFKGGQWSLTFDPKDPHGNGAPVQGDLPFGAIPDRVAIGGACYRLAAVPVAPEIGSAAFRLRRLDTGNDYHVLRDRRGLVTCDCGDYLFRHEGTAGMCEHGRALVRGGLLEGPTPIATTLGRREFIGRVSVLRNATPDRASYAR